MERTETAGAPTAAANLRYVRELHLCGGRLTYTAWRLDLDDGSADRSVAEFIASAYVPPDMRWEYPDAKVGSKLPPAGSARKGDFGEIWAGTLYSQIVGCSVPFQRLEGKPAKKSTLQGGDLLAVTLAHGVAPQPVAVEVKYRTKIDGGVLTEMTDSLSGVDEDYLATAWEFGVTLMDRHPEAERSFAHSAAVSLARLRTPDEPLPPHERHAVVLGPGSLTAATIEKQWGSSPPVSHLHVIEVVGGEATIDRLYDLSAELSYADVASGVPALIESKDVVAGIAAPASSTSALALAADLTTEPVGIVEAALWLLADWDGMGAARARHLAETATMPAVQGLARLLTGAAGRAREALDGNDDLLELVEAVTAAWRQELDRTSLLGVAEAVAGRQSDAAIAQSIRYTGAAVGHRLARHPRAVLAAAGSGGPCVTHVVEHLSRVGIQALWPSQAKAIGGGLLDSARPCLALKMPTSAGKTLLIELLVAETLDTEPDAVVAILAPSRALVSQLSSDLRRRLGDTAEVRSSHGGMDFDLEDPSADGILSGHGVATLTPERFDLEWRRATVGDGTASIEHLKLLIVDEAHLLMEGVRGAQLELVVARALRRGVRVVVLSSQFPDVGAIARWLDGNEVESDWTPTWLQRFAYFTSSDKVAGFLQAEVGEPERLFTLDKKATPGTPSECPPGRPDETMAVAALHQADGLVIVYANERIRISKLVEAASVWFPQDAPLDPGLSELASRLGPSEQEHAALLRAGIGVHHAGVPRPVRQAVEQAARQNLLKVVICTSTLLEGVDFPASTVVAAYPPWTQGTPQIARLRNLAGRAGRGGRHTHGTLVVMCSESKHADRWLRAFRMNLPVTPTALTSALRFLVSRARHIDLSAIGEETPPALAHIDALIVAALAEGAVIDGDLRTALEGVLGRTLWATGTDATAKDILLTQAMTRSAHVRNRIGDDAWRSAFYRSGLPLLSALALRKAVQPAAVSFCAALEDMMADLSSWLLWIASDAAPQTPLLARWADLDGNNRRKALTMWVEGQSVEDLERDFADEWPVLEREFGLLPWVATAAVEFMLTAAGRPDLRDHAHASIAIARLRYGVPTRDLCEFVRQGVDRTMVTIWKRQYDALPDGNGHAYFDEFVAQRVAEEVAEAQRLADEAEREELRRSAPEPQDALAVDIHAEYKMF